MSSRLDRATFHMATPAEAEQYHRTHSPATLVGRLRAARYLNSVTYNFDLHNPPLLDRTAFLGCVHVHRYKG